MWGRLVALVLLAFGFLRALARRATPTRPLSRFREQYQDDGILAVTAEEAIVLTSVGRCVACGKCDRGEATRIRESTQGYRGMMAFSLSGARSLPDYPAASHMIAGIGDEAFETAERACPVHVPLLALARLVRGHAQRMADAT